MRGGAPSGESQNLTVVLRVRPLSDEQLARGKERIVHVLDGQMVILTNTRDEDDILRAKRSREKRYMFDIAFDSFSTQLDIYLSTTKCLVDSVLEGINATVFAYGPTGTGKTYTMLGTNDDPGIMALALNEIFTLIRTSKNKQWTYTVVMSYLEVYNEAIRDLLQPESVDLELREDSSGVTVAGLTEFDCNSTQEVMDMLRDGNKRRTTEPTAINKTSSRSHAVLQVTVRRMDRIPSLHETQTVGKLYMIDLAGSERATTTKNRGTRLVEGAHINRSLLALGNCIKALSNNGSSYVNYRDSKLTRLLKDSLGGNCKTVMIAHISPVDRMYDESRNTLQYADRAKRIKTKVRVNLQTVSHHIAKYPIIVEELHKEIERLKKKLGDSVSLGSSASVQSGLAGFSKEDKDRETANNLKAELCKVFNEQQKVRHSLTRIEGSKQIGKLNVEHMSTLLSQWNEIVPPKYPVLPDIAIGEEGAEGEVRELDVQSIVTLGEEPEQVCSVRGALGRMSARRKKEESVISKLKESWDKLFEKYKSVEEELDEKVEDEEQKEILQMLLRVHQLELELTGSKEEVSTLCKAGEEQGEWLRQQQRFNAESMKLICAQRDLLNQHKIECPTELYDIYKTVNERALDTYVLPRIATEVSITSPRPPQSREGEPMFMKTYTLSQSRKSSKDLPSFPKAIQEREQSPSTIHVLSTPSLTGPRTPPLTPPKHSPPYPLQPSSSSIPMVGKANLKALQLQRLRKLKTEPLNSPATGPSNLGQTYNKFDIPKADKRKQEKIAEKARIYAPEKSTPRNKPVRKALPRNGPPQAVKRRGQALAVNGFGVNGTQGKLRPYR